MKELGSFHWRLLTGRATRAELENLSSRHLLLGLLWTWVVGMGRWWDDPNAGLLQHLGVGSRLYVFVLAGVLWMFVAPLRPRRWSYFGAHTYVCLTAAPALLYALPVERWLSVDIAAKLNLAFLAWSLAGVCRSGPFTSAGPPAFRAGAPSSPWFSR